jgi:hypothetical protein
MTQGAERRFRTSFRDLASGVAQAELARRLNAELARTGKPAPLRAKNWDQARLSAMVRRRTYLGEIPVQAEPGISRVNVAAEWQPGAHEAIISRDLWDAAQAAIAERRHRPGRSGGAKPKGNHLLTGRLLKHSCGQAMTPRTVPRAAPREPLLRYLCSGRKTGLCEGLQVDAVAVDAAIANFLADVGIDAEASLAAATLADPHVHVWVIAGVLGFGVVADRIEQTPRALRLRREAVEAGIVEQSCE